MQEESYEEQKGADLESQPSYNTNSMNLKKAVTEEDESISLSPPEKVFSQQKSEQVIPTFIVVLSTIVFLGAASWIYNRPHDLVRISGILDRIVKSSKSVPIEDIQLSQTQCPNGYQNISLGHFVGLMETEHRKIDQVPFTNMYHWGSQLICAKYIEEKPEFLSKSDCESKGKKFCSSKYCVSQGTQCPITHIYNGTQSGLINGGVFELNSKHFSFERKPEHDQFIRRFNFSYYFKPCSAEGFGPLIENYTSPLFNRELNCGEYGLDESAQNLDKMNETIFYEQNQVNNLLPYIKEEIQNNSIYLLALSNNYKQSKTCFEHQHIFENTHSILNEINSVQFVLIYFIFAIQAAQCLFFSGYLGKMNKLKGSREAIPQYNRFYSIALVFIIVVEISICVYLKNLTNLTGDLKSVINNDSITVDCILDNPSQNAFKHVRDFLNYVSSNYQMNLVVALIGASLKFIFIAMVHKWKYNNYIRAKVIR